jgi:hypothetical protein
METVHDEKRGCGWRRPGTYLVSGTVSTGGFAVSEEVSDLIMFTEPVPIDPTTVVTRGYMYVDGERFMHGQASPTAPRLERDIAEAQGFAWQVFGMDLYRRISGGICRGAEGVNDARARVSAVAWDDRGAYAAEAQRAYSYIESLREVCGDLVTLPAVIAAKQAAYLAGEGAELYGHGLTGAGAALAAAWRLVDVGRRLKVVELVRHAARMMTATTAKADVAYALRYQPPRYDVAPDILDWVGSTHYPTAEAFIEEANRLGISRRMPGMPKAIVTPWSRSFLAHGNVDLGLGERGPAVFGYYHIAQAQQVIGDDELVPEGWYEARGVQPVRVERAEPSLLPA